MKGIFGLFLIFVFSSIICGQTPESLKPEHPSAKAQIERYSDNCFLPELSSNIKARTEDFFSALMNEPTAKGIIINTGTNKEVAKRKAQMRSVIKLRKYDENRVVYARGVEKGSEAKTQFFLIVPGNPVQLPAIKF